jgi:hypothetical protein
MTISCIAAWALVAVLVPLLVLAWAMETDQDRARRWSRSGASQRAIAEKRDKTIEKWFISKLPTYYIMVDKDYQQCDEVRKQFPNFVFNIFGTND